MANFTGEAEYRRHVMDYQRFLSTAPKTPRGLTWLDKWGSNRYAGKFSNEDLFKMTYLALYQLFHS